jgi:hypothetical protein
MEVMLGNLIALKMPWSSVGFEPSNPGYNDMHATTRPTKYTVIVLISNRFIGSENFELLHHRIIVSLKHCCLRLFVLQTVGQWWTGNKVNGILQVTYSPHFTRKSPRGGWWLWCGSGGKFTGEWLLLVENSMTHQGVTLLHTD